MNVLYHSSSHTEGTHRAPALSPRDMDIAKWEWSKITVQWLSIYHHYSHRTRAICLCRRDITHHRHSGLGGKIYGHKTVREPISFGKLKRERERLGHPVLFSFSKKLWIPILVQFSLGEKEPSDVMHHLVGRAFSLSIRVHSYLLLSVGLFVICRLCLVDGVQWRSHSPEHTCSETIVSTYSERFMC